MIETSAQILQQLDLNIIQRAKITMSAFGGEHVMSFAVPVKPGFAKAGAGGNDCLITRM